jgi:hypothetical protein
MDDAQSNCNHKDQDDKPSADIGTSWVAQLPDRVYTALTGKWPDAEYLVSMTIF